MSGRLHTLARVWLALIALTVLSITVAEQLTMRVLAIAAIFVIAAVKAELVMAHFMEICAAERYWLIMYSIWLVVVTMMLVIGHMP